MTERWREETVRKTDGPSVRVHTNGCNVIPAVEPGNNLCIALPTEVNRPEYTSCPSLLSQKQLQVPALDTELAGPEEPRL